MSFDKSYRSGAIQGQPHENTYVDSALAAQHAAVSGFAQVARAHPASPLESALSTLDEALTAHTLALTNLVDQLQPLRREVPVSEDSCSAGKQSFAAESSAPSELVNKILSYAHRLRLDTEFMRNVQHSLDV